MHQRLTYPCQNFAKVPAVVLVCLALLAIRCGGGGGPPTGAATSDAKAITSFSIVNPAASGVIDENAKTITINLPCGTDVSALVATFSTTGASVKIGSTVQVSGTTPNNFSGPVVYTVTAADGTSVAYTVNVRVAGLAISHCVEHPSDCTWTGRATSTSGPLTITADPVRFQFDHADGNRVTFKPVSGTAVEAEPPCSINPNTQQITASNSAAISTLTIDYAHRPATYFIIAGTQWPGCVTCDGYTVCAGLGGPWCGDPVHPVRGSVSADGRTIEGTTSTIPAYSWRFTRDYTVDITCPQ